MIDFTVIVLSILVYIAIIIIIVRLMKESGFDFSSFKRKSRSKEGSQQLILLEKDETKIQILGSRIETKKKQSYGIKEYLKDCCKFYLPKKINYPREKNVSQKQLIRIFLLAILWRFFILGVSIIAIRIFYEDTNAAISLDTIVSYWKRWDAKNYIEIARVGYANHLENGEPIFLVFFPLYSYILRVFYLLIPNYDLCAFIVSYLTYALGCCYMYRLVSYDYGKKIAKRAVIYLSIFPFSFHFGGIMTEGVFFFTCVATLYYIRTHQWGKMAIAGALCSFSRMHGILLVVVATIEMFTFYRPFEMLRNGEARKLSILIVKRIGYVLSMGIGTLGYLLINKSVAGDAFAFLTFQKKIWYQGSTYFTNTLTYIMEYTFLPEKSGMTRASIWIPEFTIFIIALGLILYAFKRHYTIYITYFLMYLLLNYSLTWLISGGRYMSCAIPMFIILAELSCKHPWVDRLVTVSCSIFLGIYLTGFLFLKQII